MSGVYIFFLPPPNWEGKGFQHIDEINVLSPPKLSTEGGEGRKSSCGSHGVHFFFSQPNLGLAGAENCFSEGSHLDLS